MRQHQALDVRVRGDLSDHGGRHVQAPLDSSGSFRNGIVGDEHIGVRRQLDRTFALTGGVAAKRDDLPAGLYAPRKRRYSPVNHAHG